MKPSGDSKIAIYETPDGQTRLQVKIETETVWLTQSQMAHFFQTTKPTINEHIKNIYKERELSESETKKKLKDHEYSVKPTNYYNLGVVISVGYRVKTSRGAQFRVWASQQLKEYIVKGFALDDERLKAGPGRSRYFEELLQRIRDIRSSERNFYQRITDIYATSSDYRPGADLTKKFYAVVQNRMRKNLSEPESKRLGQVVSFYLDFAELQAINNKPMTMKDWATKLVEF